MNDQCPVCGSKLNNRVHAPKGRDVTFFECRSCGQFTLSNSLVEGLPSILKKHDSAPQKIGHALRLMQMTNSGAEVYTNTIGAILEQRLPRPKEQADLFIRWLAESQPKPGETVWVEPKTHSSIIGSQTPNGFAMVLDHLFEVGVLVGTKANANKEPGRAHVALSFKGWEIYEQLRHGRANYRKAFMAMKFGDTALDSVFIEVFKPSALEAGFELNKLDELPRAGLIDDRLRVEIQAADFLVADLTHDNLGAYWEAGYAEGLGKPVIYTCEREKFEKHKTHFDTNHHLTIIWESVNPSAAGEQLKATIRATLPHLAKQENR